MKQKRGVTMISLVITIIVIILLVTIVLFSFFFLIKNIKKIIIRITKIANKKVVKRLNSYIFEFVLSLYFIVS